jgi:hypothetical protein
VIELAEIFRRYGPAYRARFGPAMPPSHAQVMRAITQCRTPALGGHVYACPDCGQTQYLYHSCRNRHCPKCQHENAQRWLQRQFNLQLPVSYFMLTFTLPGDLRPFARRHQKCVYDALFRASAEAAQQLARDPRFVGGQLGLVGVLHTWARDLSYHPHVHYLVPAGGLADDGQTWLPSRSDFLVPVQALSLLFRAKFRDAVHQTEWFSRVPAAVWEQDWVVHCLPVGNGLTAFKYLAPYIFRVALSNRRLVKVEDDQVTFRYRASGTGETRFCTLPAEQFIQRFLQHVLPRNFVKVRYYGLFSPGHRQQLTALRQQLGAPPLAEPSSSTAASHTSQAPVTEPLRLTPVAETSTVNAPPTESLLSTPAADANTGDAPPAQPLSPLPTADPDTPANLASPAVTVTPHRVRCPACGQLMQPHATLSPHGRSPP